MSGTKIIRKLELDDYSNGFLELLTDLTQVGDISYIDFLQRWISISNNPVYQIWVIVDEQARRVIGSGTLLIEEKFIHNLGKVAHLEDIVISSDYQGQGLGRKLIDQLVGKAREAGCYKVILDCLEDVAPFYQKSGFRNNGSVMRLNLKNF